MFAVFLLAFAGIPLTSGFAGKFAVFKAAAEGGAGALVVVGVISSAIAAFFYIRVIVLMFFSEPQAGRPDGRRAVAADDDGDRGRAWRSRWCSAWRRSTSWTWRARRACSCAEQRVSA